MKRSLIITIIIVVVGLGYYTFFMSGDGQPEGDCRMEDVSVDQIIAQYMEAVGGEDVISNLRNLRIVQDFPDHAGFQIAEIERPNKVRLGEYVVFDGETAYILDPPEAVPEEEYKDFEVDIAWYIPAFIDYPAEYTGTLAETEAYTLEVELPLGAQMTYYIDKETGLITKITAEFVLYGEEQETERGFSDYMEVDGIMYAHAFTYEGRNGVETVTVEDIEFNLDLSGRFIVPE